ncbi:MAG: hypothetical protein ACOY3P_08080 [Planctomycetota bacterium]
MSPIRTLQRTALPRHAILCAVAILSAFPFASCRRQTPVVPSASSAGGGLSDQTRDEQFRIAIQNLFRLEEFESAEMTGRLAAALQGGPTTNSEQTADPLLTTWPEPEMLRQIVNRLNQWARSQPPPRDWSLDPAVQVMPNEWQRLPMVKDLGEMRFSQYDGFYLLQSAWLREVATWVCGDELDDVEKATRLFNWTVGDIQVMPAADFGSVPAGAQPLPDPAEDARPSETSADEADPDVANANEAKPNEANPDEAKPGETKPIEAKPDESSHDEQKKPDPAATAEATVGSAWDLNDIPQVPWESVFFGQGTNVERAWVFVLLARQKRLDAAVLAIADADDPQAPPRPWAVAVMVDGEAYLYDPVLRAPIPGPDGPQWSPEGGLKIRPATLRQLRANPELLRMLDLSPTRKYPVVAADLERVVALIEASPSALSARMRAVEARLAGDQSLVLTIAPTTAIERWRTVEGIKDARLWAAPYETLARRLAFTPDQVRMRLVELLPYYLTPFSPPLRQGRMLYLEGRMTGEPSAAMYLQQARPSNESLESQVAQLEKLNLEQIQRQLRAAMPIGASPEQIAAAEQQAVEAARRSVQMQLMMVMRVKEQASYWLGLVAMAQANYPMAIDYFSQRTLVDFPGGALSIGALQNLGRALDRSGQADEAARVYSADPSSYGNMLRVKWLNERAEEL